jgi:hypothetical protein
MYLFNRHLVSRRNFEIGSPVADGAYFDAPSEAWSERLVITIRRIYDAPGQKNEFVAKLNVNPGFFLKFLEVCSKG